VNRAIASLMVIAGVACSRAPQPMAQDANAGIDSLNAHLVQAYRSADPQRYGTLFTDSAVFEWPAIDKVRGRAGMEGMARSNWVGLKEMDLQLTVASRRVATDHATEFGAFQQSWRDSTGARMIEFGRYVHLLSRQPDGRWLIDRFAGFEDSLRRYERRIPIRAP
jgi:ketosteroid isomerase-like protein